LDGFGRKLSEECYSAAKDKEWEAQEACHNHIPAAIARRCTRATQTIIGWQDWIASAAACHCHAGGCSCDECDFSCGSRPATRPSQHSAKLGRRGAITTTRTNRRDACALQPVRQDVSDQRCTAWTATSDGRRAWEREASGWTAQDERGYVQESSYDWKCQPLSACYTTYTASTTAGQQHRHIFCVTAVPVRPRARVTSRVPKDILRPAINLRRR
jgi:hypothetical protein